MPVHVGELRSELVADGSRPPGEAHGPPPSVDEVADQVREAIRRAAWLAERVAAENFDD
jgi:hypothetical protein